MEKKREMPAENEARSLVKNNFRKEVSGSSTIHTYNLSTHLMIQKAKVFLPRTFPQSSGQSRTTNENSYQQRTSICDYVTVVK